MDINANFIAVFRKLVQSYLQVPTVWGPLDKALFTDMGLNRSK
jgi:hypothetical protein